MRGPTIAFHSVVVPVRESRLQDAGLLGTKPVPDAAREINAMWEGIANAELRGEVLRIMTKDQEEKAWRDARTTVVRGFASTQPTR